jgi:hypothetical protein
VAVTMAVAKTWRALIAVASTPRQLAPDSASPSRLAPRRCSPVLYKGTHKGDKGTRKGGLRSKPSVAIDRQPSGCAGWSLITFPPMYFASRSSNTSSKSCS